MYPIKRFAVGKPQSFSYKGKDIYSAIHKEEITGPIYLYEQHFEGDEQADKKVHGGPHKAICAYPYEHYQRWMAAYNLELELGAFGENLTIEGLTEESAIIGQTFSLGEAIVQICQPRFPCYKLAARVGRDSMIDEVIQTGMTGYYFRVLQPGMVDSERDLLISRETPAHGVTVADVNTLQNTSSYPELWLKVKQASELAPGIYERLAKKYS